MSETRVATSVEELIGQLDEAVEDDCTDGKCGKIKEILKRMFRAQNDFLDASLLVPLPDCYARRLLHRDPAGRYSVVVMVWGPGQETPLHDHAGKWCVECVYKGRVKVDSYRMESEDEDGLARLTKVTTVHAGVGAAGALIPPFEYHVLANDSDDPSVTVHVYAEELTCCNKFIPERDGYRKEKCELCYSP